MKLITLFTLITLSLPCSAQRSMQYTKRPADQAIVWQEDLRERFGQLLNITDLMKEGHALPFNPVEIRSEFREGYQLSEFEINTTKARRMRIILTRPVTLTSNGLPIPSSAPGGGWPAVVSIHGHGGKILSVYDDHNYYRKFANTLASEGFVTIACVVSQHEIYEDGRTLMGERLWDLMRCVDYLQTLSFVNPERIGCGGLSLGGEMSMWLAAMDTRIKSSVSCGFLTRMDQMEQGHCMCWKFDGLRELVDYADIYAMTAPRALMCQNGLLEPKADFTVELATEAMHEIIQTYIDLGHPERVCLHAHAGGHVVDPEAMHGFFLKTL